MTRATRTLLGALAIAVVAGAAIASGASANDRFLLDKKAETPGHVVLKGNGTAYVAWSHAGGKHADHAEFCKIPKGGKCKDAMKLPLPSGNAVTESVAGAFPLIDGDTLYVVAPRYVDNDVVIWQSSNGGQSFSSPTVLTGGYSNKTDPTDVILDQVVLLIGAHNPGLGFSYTGIANGGYTFGATQGSVQGASLVADPSIANLYEAYWTQKKKYSVHYFTVPGVASTDTQWTGPIAVSKGYGGELTSGSNGNFIVTQDYTGGKYPKAVRVRGIDGSDVGPATTLAKDKKIDLLATGDISEAPNGHVAVAWPLEKRSGKMVLRLFESNNGKHFGKATPIAHLGNAFGIGDNLQLAYGSGGSGVTTFLNGSGLHLADLKKLK